ncbi:hypothetical protein EJ02DRAFT_318720, partial [Clathrospora elynae]
LDYHTFSRWRGLAELLQELSKDGIVVDHLWDTSEDMRVSSGDWDARVRPGWKVDVLCGANTNELSRSSVYDRCSSSENNDDSDSDSDEDGGDDMSESEDNSDAVRRERPWWFARWKERVERGTPMRGKVEQEPSFIMMLIWATSMMLCAGVVNLV